MRRAPLLTVSSAHRDGRTLLGYVADTLIGAIYVEYIAYTNLASTTWVSSTVHLGGSAHLLPALAPG